MCYNGNITQELSNLNENYIIAMKPIGANRDENQIRVSEIN